MPKPEDVNRTTALGWSASLEEVSLKAQSKGVGRTSPLTSDEIVARAKKFLAFLEDGQ